jgi:DNA polymerase I-like protein with 3'-5' exonuclease and polymerase domains
VRIVTQNGLYDWGWLRTDAGIRMPPSERLEEIGALATLVDENRYQYSLDALCAWRGLPGKDIAALQEGAAAIGLPKRSKLTANIWQLPARYVGTYAEADAVNTLLLFESLYPVLDREGTRDAYRLEVDLLPMVQEMRRRGVRIDIAAAERARDLLLGKRDAALAELSQKLEMNVGMEEVRGRKWLLATFDQHGIKYPLTEKGNPSFKGGATGWMHRHEHWLPQLIAKANRYHKAAADFLETYILQHVVNGRIHAEIHPYRSDDGGARSLRFSYSDPPLQQMVGRDEEIAPLIRGVFLPEEGEVWAKPDISQQEFRFIVHYAAQLKLQRAQEAADRYRADPNTDFHELVAMWTGCERDIAKNVNFAKAFGAGVRKFAAMIGKPEGEARAIYQKYDAELPFVSALAKYCEQQAQRFGYLELYDGARRHWAQWVALADWAKGAGPCSREEAERRIKDPAHSWYRKGPLRRADTYKALNALIQGSAARHTKLWMREVWRAGIVPLLQMHDSLDCSVASPEQAELVARLGREAVKLEVPIEVDLNYGRNWGDATHSWDELQHDKGTVAPSIAPVESDDAEPAVTADDDPGHNETCKAFARPELVDSSAESPAPPYVPAFETAASELAGGNGADCSERPMPILAEVAPGDTRFEAMILAALSAERDPTGEARANGHDGVGYPHAERDDYSEQNGGKPYAAECTRLAARGYLPPKEFPYTLADGTLLFWEARFELKPGITPTKKQPRKQVRVHHLASGQDVLGAGTERRVIYNWQAVMRAGPGATVCFTEGAPKSQALIDKGLLASAVAFHSWKSGCAEAVRGLHAIFLEDHPDSEGRNRAEKFSADARKYLAPVAESFRIVPALHLWKNLGRNDEPPPSWDVKDWLVAGGDAAKLLEICHEIPAEGTELDEWDAGDLLGSGLPPPRQWLYGRQLCRRFLSSLVAPGDVGKTTKRLTQAIELATGRELLGHRIYQRSRVLVISLEDDRDELWRRLLAICKHHGIDPVGLKGWLFCRDLNSVKLVEEVDSERQLGMLYPMLCKAIERRQPDLVILDPFVKLHALDENKNPDMDFVCSQLIKLAQEYNIAVDSPAHTRKGQLIAGDSDNRRGATAQRDAGRLDYTLTAMTETEAEQFGIDADERKSYVRLDRAKANIVRAIKATWYRLVSVPLGNATELYPEGDEVQALETWVPPDAWIDLDAGRINRILDKIDAGMPDGNRYSGAPTARKRAAWPIIVAEVPEKTEAQAREIIRSWLKTGLLISREYENSADRKKAEGLYVDLAKRPVSGGMDG